MIDEQQCSLSAVVLTSVEAFDEIESEWNELHLASFSSVFQSHAWLRTWWRHFGENLPFRMLHMVLVRKNGRLVGSGPFFIETRKICAFASTRELRFIGEGLSDYNDLLLDPGNVRVALESVAEHITALWKSIDAISFAEIPGDSPARSLLFERLKRSGVSVSMEQCDTCPRIKLHDTWAATLGAIDGDQRRQLLKKCRQMSDAHTVAIETIDDPSVLEQAMEDLIGMHQKRMEETGKIGIFSNSRNDAFLRELSADFLKRGWLFLSFLRINDRRVAASFSYFFRKRVCFHIAGLGDAGDARKYSPGIVLHAMCMEEAIGKGAKVYDFLRGTEEYKYRFGAVDHMNWCISASRIRPHIRLLKGAGSVLGMMRRAVVPRGLHALVSR